MPEHVNETQEHQHAGATQEAEAQNTEEALARFADNRATIERQRALQTRILYKPPEEQTGHVKKGKLVRSGNIHFYVRNEQTQTFERNPNSTLRKGTRLTEVLKTENKNYVWIKTVNGEEGYVRKKNLQISWSHLTWSK